MFFLLVAFFSFAIVNYSQTNTCDLTLQFFDRDATGLLGNVNAKLIKFESKKQYKVTNISDSLIYSGLNSGIYQVELNKKGYKKKIKKFLVDCSFIDNSNKVFENVYLWKGNSKEVVKLDSTNITNSFALSKSDDSSRNTSFSVDKNAKPINDSSINLVRPPYPPAAKAVRASGQVNVQVTIDEDGNVVLANVVDGHALLRVASIKAVRQSKFSPTLLSGFPVKVTGVVVYNFNPN